MRCPILGGIALLTLGTLFGCATQSGFSKSFSTRLTETQNEWRLRNGGNYNAAVPKVSKINVPRPLNGYDLKTILDRLVYFSPLRGYPVQVGLVNDPKVNAFTDQNRIFITTGLLTTFQYSQDALAAVLAHELGHILAHHNPNQNKHGAWLETLSYATPALSVLPFGSLYGSAAGTAMREGAKVRKYSYSRLQENEADALGVLIATQAGYNPYGLSDFLDKTGGGSGFGMPQTVAIPTSIGAIPESAAVALLSASPLYRLHPPSSKRKQIVVWMDARSSGKISGEELKKKSAWLEKLYEAVKSQQPREIKTA